jgi:hypothetical protein
MTFFQRGLRNKLAKQIDKPAFLEALKIEWSRSLTKDSNIEEEVQKAINRVRKSGFSDVYKTAGITEEDYRQVITEIVKEKANGNDSTSNKAV